MFDLTGTHQQDQCTGTKKAIIKRVKLTCGDNEVSTLFNSELATFKKPDTPPLNEPGDKADDPKKMDPTNALMWKQEVNNCINNKAKLETNLNKTCAMMWGQTSPTMRAKVEETALCASALANRNLVELLKMMQSVSHSMEETTCVSVAAHGAVRQFRVTLNQCLVKFTNQDEMLMSMGIEMPVGNGMKKVIQAITKSGIIGALTADEVKTGRQACLEFFLSWV